MDEVPPLPDGRLALLQLLKLRPNIHHRAAFRILLNRTRLQFHLVIADTTDLALDLLPLYQLPKLIYVGLAELSALLEQFGDAHLELVQILPSLL